MIRVLLVDDQPLLRLGMSMVIEPEIDIEVVGEANNGREGINQAALLRPDIVLMDVRMPVLDGIAATREIVQHTPSSRVIILTTFDLDEYAFAGLRAGASGFMLKDSRPAELLQAIRVVAHGDAVISTRITRQLLTLFGDHIPNLSDPELPTSAHAAAQGNRLAALTEREREVLVAIGEGLSNLEIASRFVLSESTVKTHVGRVLQKLELRDRVQAVILAYETGLVSL